MAGSSFAISGPGKIEMGGGGGGQISPSIDNTFAERMDPLSALASYLGTLRSREKNGALNLDPTANKQADPLEELFNRLVPSKDPFASAHQPQGGGGSMSAGFRYGSEPRDVVLQRQADQEANWQRDFGHKKAEQSLQSGAQSLSAKKTILDPGMLKGILQRLMQSL